MYFCFLSDYLSDFSPVISVHFGFDWKFLGFFLMSSIIDLLIAQSRNRLCFLIFLTAKLNKENIVICNYPSTVNWFICFQSFI